jgi:hypothetical protein
MPPAASSVAEARGVEAHESARERRRTREVGNGVADGIPLPPVVAATRSGAVVRQKESNRVFLPSERWAVLLQILRSAAATARSLALETLRIPWQFNRTL